jgi:predicted aconitase/predicted aconitase with swiveling domain
MALANFCNSTILIDGSASGALLSSELELSFWGGVNSQSGEIIDRHHPLSGQHLKDTILAIPGGRGSCSGSGVILELLLNGNGPRGLVFSRLELILTLGVVVANEVFGKSIPVIQVSTEEFSRISAASKISIGGSQVVWDGIEESTTGKVLQKSSSHPTEAFRLSELDEAMLSGERGEACAAAMRIVLEMSRLMGTSKLIDVKQVHIDGCVYTGPGSLAFAERLRGLGGKFVVPTTLNSISVDQKRWRAQGVDTNFGTAAEKLATAFTDMGAAPTFTCAPYLHESAPERGDQIAWAESNAVVYANSVLGARTMKYPDFLDIAIALTGRAPCGGMHLSENRVATVIVDASLLSTLAIPDDLLYAAMGYCIGRVSGSRIPAVTGLQSRPPSTDDLKAFGAAFATVSSSPMFHMLGVTSEAGTLEDATGAGKEAEQVQLTPDDLDASIKALNTAGDDQTVGLISLGNPHFSSREMRRLAKICRGRKKCPSVAFIICCGRATYGLATQAGLVAELEKFGAQLIEDTRWCMIGDPIIKRDIDVIMTNSGKYAHYGPGLTGKRFRFGSLEACVDAVCKA